MADVYFSINPDVIKNVELDFDIFINSSSTKVQKFICLLKQGDKIEEQTVVQSQEKYTNFYVKESERRKYIQLLGKNKIIPKKERTHILKDSAVSHLKNIVGVDFRAANKTQLAESVMECKEIVTQLMSLAESTGVQEIKDLLLDLSVHDYYTYDHSVNVCIYAMKFYVLVYPNAEKEKLTEMGMGALLHDIGKTQVSTEVINKPSELTDEEFAIIKMHPVYGKEIFSSLLEKLPKDMDWKNIIDVIHQHHENVDGSGYPLKMQSNQINNMAKICMFADIFDALTSKRSYSEALPREKAISLMSRMVGTKLDPVIFKSLSRLAEFDGYQKCNLSLEVVHPQFDPSIPYKHIELLRMGSNSYTNESSKIKDYGKVIQLPEKRKKIS